MSSLSLLFTTCRLWGGGLCFVMPPHCETSFLQCVRMKINTNCKVEWRPKTLRWYIWIVGVNERCHQPWADLLGSFCSTGQNKCYLFPFIRKKPEGKFDECRLNFPHSELEPFCWSCSHHKLAACKPFRWLMCLCVTNRNNEPLKP